MTLKTYYGKLDCRSTVVNFEHVSGEVYKSFCDFMSYMSQSNVVNLVAWNSGANAPTGSFEQRTYWDGALPFGGNAFSLWRFNATPERNFDWYLYAQVVSGGASSIGLRQPFNIPVSGYAEAADNIQSGAGRGILIQAAVCFSGSTSFNPWNGDFGNGNGNTSIGAGNGSVKWVSGSNNRRMYILPRSNNLGGATVTQRANCDLFPYIASSETSTRVHFICDGDAIICANDRGLDTTYSFDYVGPFELRNSLSSSGIAGTAYGLMRWHTASPNTNTLPVATVFGGTSGASTTGNGGVAVPISTAVSGSKDGILNIIENFSATTYQPNYATGKYDEFPYMVGISESPLFGLVGQMNSGLVRLTRQVLSEDVSSDFSRAIIKGNTTISDYCVSVPWTGSMAPGTSFSRTGSQYTWVKDYG